MKLKNWVATGAATILSMALALSTHAAGDPANGRALYASCASCHGANGEGNQALNAPRIAGQFDWYTHRQLMNWKNGVRGTHPKDMYGMQMIGMAATLIDETAVKNISAYIANLGK